MENIIQYDLIVIGSGGGSKIARPAAELGLKVAIIEKDKLGGTCLNRGCIPSKMLIHPADVIQEIKESNKYYIHTSESKIDFKKLVEEINTSTGDTSDSIKNLYTGGKIKNLDFYNEKAEFLSNQILQVGEKKLSGKKIVLAVGARPNIPDIPGLKGTPYMTSTEALKNTKLPKKLLIIGGGIIATELGSAYSGFGSDVHFLVRSGLISNVDSEVKEEFNKSFTKKNHVHLHTLLESVKYNMNTNIFTVHYRQDGQEKTITGDALLVATGVIPNSDVLKVENTNIKINKRGYIEVNNTLQTSVKNIFAIGDCVGNYMFRHSVNFEAEYLFSELIEQNLERPNNKIKYPEMPWAIFSNPQVAGVGKTENELQKDGIKYFKGTNYYKNSAMGDALKSENGLVKLLFDAQTEILIGAHIVGVEASNMIHMLIVFINTKSTLSNILATIFIHPALNENIRNAARAAKKNRERL